MESLILNQTGALIALAFAYYWIKSLQKTIDDNKLEHRDELKCQSESHDQEINRMQERLDRMQERQNKLFDRALRQTDLKDTEPKA